MALRSSTSILASRILTPRSTFVCQACISRTQSRHQSTAATVSAPELDDAAAETPARGKPRWPVPKPTPFVPNVSTFLSLIGRELSQHASKFSSWEEMFSISPNQLKARGLDPPRARRYFLRWRNKFRKGEYGIGGDLTYVKDGVAELRVCEVPEIPREPVGGTTEETSKPATRPLASTSRTPGFTRLILNVPEGATTYKLERGQTTKDLKKPAGLKLKEGHIITGSYVLPKAGCNGNVAMLKVTEGMWEDKRGHKVNGGERRRAEFMHKARVAESKKAGPR